MSIFLLKDNSSVAMIHDQVAPLHFAAAMLFCSVPQAPFPLLRFRMKTEWNVSIFGLVFPLKKIENRDI